MTNILKNIISPNLYSYDKTKVGYLKAILPFVIILHHLSGYGLKYLDFMKSWDRPAIAMFFAMSGFGLIISYKRNKNYLEGFIKRSMTKLYLPFLFALMSFWLYYIFTGISIIDVANEDICAVVPASWYIFVLTLLYLFFYIVFKYIKCNDFIKCVIVVLLVAIYYMTAKYAEIFSWRYLRVPAFCVGVFFGLYDERIRQSLRKYHCFILIVISLVLSRNIVTQPIGGGYIPVFGNLYDKITS